MGEEEEAEQELVSWSLTGRCGKLLISSLFANTNSFMDVFTLHAKTTHVILVIHVVPYTFLIYLRYKSEVYFFIFSCLCASLTPASFLKFVFLIDF